MDAPVGDATAGWAFMPAPMPVMPAQQFALVPQQQQPQQPERHWPASWPPAGGVGLLAGASAQHSHLPPVAPSQPGYWMLVPGHQPTEAAAPYTGQQAAPAAAPPLPRPSSGKRSGAAAAAGKGARRAQPGGISRAQTRLLQRRQRELDQGVIKGLEHQLGSLREQLQVTRRLAPRCQAHAHARPPPVPEAWQHSTAHLSPSQSLGIENQQLKQRQAALDATLEMQQKLQAAAAEARAASDLGTASDLGDEAASFSLDLAPSMAEGGAADTDAGDGGSIMDDADVDSLLADLAASAEDRSAGSGGALAAGAAGPAGDHSVPSGPVTRSTWFFSASLRQHVLWYQGQVCVAEHSRRPVPVCCHHGTFPQQLQSCRRLLPSSCTPTHAGVPPGGAAGRAGAHPAAPAALARGLQASRGNDGSAGGDAVAHRE